MTKQMPLWVLRVKWAIQERAVCRRALDWWRWKAAWLVPASIAKLVLIRVHAETGDAAGPEFVRAYDVWTTKHRLQ